MKSTSLGMLTRDPEDPYTHHSAGLAALQASNFHKAEEHFLEALRLDPNFEPAREGLLESFRARSWFYRVYLKYAFYMMGFTRAKRIGIAVGLLLGVQVVSRLLETVSPVAALGVLAVWIIFVLWTYVARSLGSLIILCDRRARHALRTREKWDAVAIGGGVVVGASAFVVGLIFEWNLVATGGIAMVLMTMPLTLSLTNNDERGRVLYGAFAVVLAILLLLVLAAILWPAIESVGVIALSLAAVGFLICTSLALCRVRYC